MQVKNASFFILFYLSNKKIYFKNIIRKNYFKKYQIKKDSYEHSELSQKKDKLLKAYLTY